MATYRHAPGEPAPFAGSYVLVDHFGKSMDFAVWCEAGDRLPLVATTGGTGPYWFHRVHHDAAGALAA